MSREMSVLRCSSRGQVMTTDSRRPPIAGRSPALRVSSPPCTRTGILAGTGLLGTHVAAPARREYAGTVTVALIAIGVIAFLLFDAYVIYRVMSRQRTADDYGFISIPGQTTVTVPAGGMKLTYQESRRAAGDEDTIYFSAPDSLEVKVTSAAGGEPLEIKGPGFGGMGSSRSTQSGRSRDLIGTVQITEPGTYTITAASPELPDAVEPKILIGK